MNSDRTLKLGQSDLLYGSKSFQFFIFNIQDNYGSANTGNKLT